MPTVARFADDVAAALISTAGVPSNAEIYIQVNSAPYAFAQVRHSNPTVVQHYLVSQVVLSVSADCLS
jgi:hypothetical protein